MPNLVRNYFAELINSVGTAWNRFWFTPSTPYTVSLVRVLVGALAVYYVASFGPDVVNLFGPGGIVPVTTVQTWTNNAVTRFSYFDYIQDPASLRAAHYAGLAVVALFAVGFLTRVTSIAALVVLISYLHRAPMLVSEAEPVLTMTVLYLCLAPAGAYFSVDAWLRRRRERWAGTAVPPAIPAKGTMTTVATRLIQVHLAAIFVTSGLAMLSAQTWWTGDAVWWMVARPLSPGFWLSSPLSRMPMLFMALTHVIVAYHLLFPLLVWNRMARPLVLVAGLIVWPIVGAVSGLYLYAAAMLAGSCIYLPAEFVALLDKRREPAAEPAKNEAVHKPTAPSQRATVRV
ncbi:MAG: HTTM domain-containing protein [Pirellulales bacterium]